MCSSHIQLRFVKINREVIISAGAINSPKLLMLSGVGPKDELEKFKVNGNLPYLSFGMKYRFAILISRFMFRSLPLPSWKELVVT